MKKRMKSAIALCSALAMLSCGALSVSAGNLTKEQLIEKYGYRCSITEQTATVDENSWAAFERQDAGANMSESISSGVANGLCYDELADGSVCITGVDFDTFSPHATVLTVPEEINGKPVKAIGSCAFQGLYQRLPELREIVLPDSIDIISDFAFHNVFCNFRSSVSMTNEEKSAYRINLPKNVVFIGYMAFGENTFAIANTQRQKNVIALPESLEYISSYAFSGEVGTRIEGLIEIDMPDSLVFMSDTTFHSWSLWLTRLKGGTSTIDADKTQIVLSDDLPAQDLPLLRSAYGEGFLNGKKNIISMVDMFRSYIQENDLDVEFHDYTRTIDYAQVYTAPEEDPLTRVSYLREKAALNAPELLNAETKAAPNTNNLGDVNLDGEVDIKDAVLISRIVAEDAEVDPLVPGVQNADINQDGMVTTDDVMEIVQKLCFK